MLTNRENDKIGLNTTCRKRSRKQLKKVTIRWSWLEARQQLYIHARHEVLALVIYKYSSRLIKRVCGFSYNLITRYPALLDTSSLKVTMTFPVKLRTEWVMAIIKIAISWKLAPYKIKSLHVGSQNSKSCITQEICEQLIDQTHFNVSLPSGP